MPSHEMEKQLQAHELHIAFTRQFAFKATDNLESKTLKSEVLCLLAVAQNRSSLLSMKEYLTHFPLLLHAQSGSKLHQQIQSYLHRKLIITPLRKQMIFKH